jgi:hypothetical protein
MRPWDNGLDNDFENSSVDQMGLRFTALRPVCINRGFNKPHAHVFLKFGLKSEN